MEYVFSLYNDSLTKDIQVGSYHSIKRTAYTTCCNEKVIDIGLKVTIGFYKCANCGTPILLTDNTYWLLSKRFVTAEEPDISELIKVLEQ